MKECTVTLNAQFTFIEKRDELPLVSEKDMGDAIRNVFKAANCRLDDVVVSDLKVFVRDEEEES